MKTCCLASILILFLTAAACGQVLSVTSPVPTGQMLRIDFHNSSPTTVHLIDTAPWRVFGPHNQCVHTPAAGDMIVPVGPSQTCSWYWNQFTSWWMPRGLIKKLVPPGWYEIRFTYLPSQSAPAKMIRVPLHIEDAAIIPTGLPKPGAKLSLLLQSPTAAGRPYQVALSFVRGTTPLPGERSLRLCPDGLFLLSISGRVPIFRNFTGWLDTRGYATATIDIPKRNTLLGLRFYAAFATFDPRSPGGIFNHSHSTRILIR